jgi:hypothetical protein
VASVVLPPGAPSIVPTVPASGDPQPWKYRTRAWSSSWERAPVQLQETCVKHDDGAREGSLAANFCGRSVAAWGLA